MPSPRAKQVFLEALGHPPGERTAIVQKACEGDAALRSQVDDLLNLHNDAVQFMSRRDGEREGSSAALVRSGTAIAGTSPLAEGSGMVIGRYKLLQQIGEGGFGVVYMAEQREPVRRVVALKIIKLGMDTRQTLARFEAERQALAMMDHPNIARVLDAGATEAGRPYFVMELVKGVPITRYCDQEQIPLTERLGLFQSVCGAVQHAHQKGIIHRDLKPSNIMITLHDGTPVPKVIDFGIAKATQQRLTDRTMFTEYGQFIGTPAYMSPEQAEMSGLDVDTRSDIYSLGVLLYELLTGSLPFDPQRLLSAGHAEMVRIIKDEEPHRPSTRLRTLVVNAEASSDRSPTAAPIDPHPTESVRRTSSIADIARMRHTDPRSLVRSLRGELDWIVMKCLEKDRTRRYETANGLARDVARFLVGETVSAAPPSPRYRFRKFLRRNRGVAITTGLVAAALLIGLTAATVSFLQARKQRNAAQSAYAAEQEHRRIALHERDKARGFAEELRQELYTSQIERIQRIIATDGFEPVKALLAGCDQELRGWEWDRLNFLADGSLLSRQSAVGAVRTVQFSSDGSRVVSAGANGLIRVLDAESLEMISETRNPGPTAGLVAAVMSRDGSVLAAIDKGVIHLWNAPYGFPTRSIRLPKNNTSCVALDPPGRRVAVGDAAVGDSAQSTQVYDVATGTLLYELEPRAARASSISFSRDGTRILVGSLSNDVSISNAVDGAMIWAERGADFVVLDAAFSPDEKLVASLGMDSRLWLRRADNGELVYSIPTRKGECHTIAFHPDGRLIAIGGSDGLITLFLTSTGERLYSLHGHEAEVTSIDFDPSGKVLVSGAVDGTVKRWHLGLNGPHVTFMQNHPINSARFTRNDDALLVAGAEPGETLWLDASDLSTEQPNSPFSNTGQVRLSSNGQRIAMSGRTAKGVWQVVVADQFMNVMLCLEPPDEGFHWLEFRSDGRLLLTATPTGLLRVWDMETSGVVWDGGTRGPFQMNRAHFSSDGRYIVNFSGEATLRVYESGSGLRVQEFSTEQGTVGALVLDALDRVFSGGSDGTIRVWDWPSGRLLKTMSGHAGMVSALSFIPGDKRLVSGGVDGSIRLWDVSSGRQVMIVGRHDSAVCDVQVSHDGATIMSCGWDNSLRLWETRQPPPTALNARYDRLRKALADPK